MLTFDEFLSTRIRLGKAQYIAFAILSLIEFMAGFQEVFQTILVKLLKNEWNISVRQQSWLGVFFFSGVMLGNVTCSILADRVGRKKILIISQSSAIGMMVFNSFSQQYYQACITILIYGLVFGISMPISQVMISEIVPLKFRGRFLVLIQFVYIIGILYLILNCYIFLDSLNQGDWRTLLRVNVIPPFLCLLGSIFFLQDSPRLYIMQGKYEEGFKILDKFGRLNDKNYQAITEQEKTAMIEWVTDQQIVGQTNVTWLDLFKGEALKVSLFILSIFSLYNLVSCGIIIITPFLVGENEDSSFMDLFLAYLVEIPSILIAVALFDNRKWGGRIKVTIYGLVIMTSGQALLYLMQEKVITYGIIMLRFSFRMIWSGLNALPAESYKTHLRSLGVGTAQGTGKVFGALVALIALPLYDYNHYVPFLYGGILTIVCMFLLFLYPIDATQKPLDQNDEQLNQPKVQLIQSDSE